MSFNPEHELPACLCEDCGGIHQQSVDDLVHTYIHAPIKSDAQILNLCFHCQYERISPTDPEDSAMYRYGQH